MNERQRLEWVCKITGELFAQDLSTEKILRTVLSMIGEALEIEHGCMLTFNNNGTVDEGVMLSTEANAESMRNFWNLLLTRGLIGYVYHGHRTIVIRDIAHDPRWPQLPTAPHIPQSGSAVGIPLKKNGRNYGVITLIHPVVDYFSDEIVHMLEAVADINLAAMRGIININSRVINYKETRYHALFEHAIVPIILTNLDGLVIDANQQALQFLGYTRDELLRERITSIHRLGTGPIGQDRYASLRRGDAVEFRSTAWKLNGDPIPVTVRARRITMQEQDVIEWVEQDMSRQIEAEQLRNDLTAMIYHDLRGPLHTVQSSLSALARQLANYDDDNLADILQVAVRSSRQLSRLINNLLDMQRLEEGKAVLKRKQTSLHYIIARAIELVQPMAAEAEIKLAFNLPNELPMIEVDDNMIQRVVTNLLENAIKYTPQKGRVTLYAEAFEDRIRISVQDTGPGIPIHIQHEIFDKFSRVKTSGAVKGFGLGLAFCRLAVEAHGGEIWVESKDDSGSTFSFTLPLKPLSQPVIV
ncbi:MAG: GAF domain-containing protein [Chloroflexi bacterium]|nr:MAG: GAF domain-containing protein [Chloroflexota bacterium]